VLRLRFHAFAPFRTAQIEDDNNCVARTVEGKRQTELQSGENIGESRASVWRRDLRGVAVEREVVWFGIM
jgi:hypothetical protein